MDVAAPGGRFYQMRVARRAELAARAREREGERERERAAVSGRRMASRQQGECVSSVTGGGGRDADGPRETLK